MSSVAILERPPSSGGLFRRQARARRGCRLQPWSREAPRLKPPGRGVLFLAAPASSYTWDAEGARLFFRAKLLCFPDLSLVAFKQQAIVEAEHFRAGPPPR